MSFDDSVTLMVMDNEVEILEKKLQQLKDEFGDDILYQDVIANITAGIEQMKRNVRQYREIVNRSQSLFASQN